MGDTCYSCTYFELYERKSSYSDDCYCEWYRTYYHPGSEACTHYKSRTYIVSAICEILELENDNEELKLFRELRNNMEKTESYKPYLDEYDKVGPYIANKLVNDNDKKLCKKIYDNKLKPIAKMIKEKNYMKAAINYENLSIMLALEFGVDLVNVDKMENSYCKKKNRKKA